MPKNRYWQYQFLVQRDGEKCASCSQTEKELVIDHIDTNRQNDYPSNIRLLCRSCNKRNTTQSHSTTSERERENIRVEAEHEDKPATMKVAEDKQPLYVAWLYENVDRQGGLTFWDAIYEGADRIDISPVTARRYLMKKLATTFKLGAGPRGHKLIMWRPGQ